MILLNIKLFFTKFLKKFLHKLNFDLENLKNIIIQQQTKADKAFSLKLNKTLNLKKRTHIFFL